MNQHVRSPLTGTPQPILPLDRPPPGVTQAADGLPRRAWTVDEVEAMVRAGIIADDERIELIGGDLVVMSPKGRFHEVMKEDLCEFWHELPQREVRISQEQPLTLAPREQPEPDFKVFPRGMAGPDVRGDTILLVVEIADSSLDYDTKVKSPRYAGAGVREYWVINAVTRVTTVFLDPGPDGYGRRFDVAGDQLLTPDLAPALAVRLDDLGPLAK